eukprot:489822_1
MKRKSVIYKHPIDFGTHNDEKYEHTAKSQQNNEKYFGKQNDEKYQPIIKAQHINFRISWNHVANCAAHEMSPKLSSTILSIIDKDHSNYKSNADIDLDEMIKILSKRHLGTDEIKYFRTLYQRATQFTPTSIADLITSKQQQNYKYESILIKDEQISKQILQDIYDVHAEFQFSNYHFEEYSVQQYKHDLDVNVQVNKAETHQIKKSMTFYPQYIINDDMIEIMDYMFCASRYIHYLRSNIDKSQRSQFHLTIMIIAQSVECVYDENIKLQHNINNIDEYLRMKNVFDYQRNTIKLHEMIHNQYTTDDIEQLGINKLTLIIDRRQTNCNNDILYVIPSKQNCNLTELNANYFIGFDFHIDFMTDTVVTYVRYGIDQQQRFYPNMLVSLIPRFFKKQQQILNKIYSNEYQNGWSVNLIDDTFDNLYKLITGTTHISVNYNRAIVDDDFNNAAKEIIFFRDLLEHELKSSMSNVKTNFMSNFNQFLIQNEYDSESIVGDILTERKQKHNYNSNIEEYFISQNQWHLFKDVVRPIIDKYHNNVSEQKKWALCKTENVLEIASCPHINHIIDILSIFAKNNFYIDSNTLSMCNLLRSYDHIVSVHKLFGVNAEISEDIKQFVMEKVGACTLIHCPVLTKHAMR